MGFRFPMPDEAPGGAVVSSMNSINSLVDNFLKTKMQGMENQLYIPKTQSEIDYRNALTTGENINNQYLPEKNQLANAYQALQNQYYGPTAQASINNTNSLTQQRNTMTPLQAQELQLKNQYYPKATEAQINAQNSLANYRQMGGPGMGVDQKQLMGFKQQLSMEHPDWSTQQVDQAASSYIMGNNQLPNGMQLPPISGLGQTYLDEIMKKRSTAPVITSGIKANQAEAELKVLNDFAQRGLKPYGDTLLGYSPSQIMDSFSSDDKSQKRLGRFIASQALQYEAAQNRIRLAQGQPGVTSTEELMRLSGQMIKTKYPKLSYAAREEAANYMDQALEEGLNARKSVGIGASSVTKKESKEKKPTLRYNQDTGDFEEIK